MWCQSHTAQRLASATHFGHLLAELGQHPEQALRGWAVHARSQQQKLEKRPLREQTPAGVSQPSDAPQLLQAGGGGNPNPNPAGEAA